jgi:hypothetical protein
MPGKTQTGWNTVRFRWFSLRRFSYTFCVVRSSESYLNGGVPVTDSITGASRPGDLRTVSTQPAEMETYEERSKQQFGHLSQNNPSRPAGLPPRKHKEFRYFLNKIPVVFGAQVEALSAFIVICSVVQRLLVRFTAS